MSSSGPLSIALDAPGGKSCGSYRGAAIGYTYSAKFSRARSMGTTVDRFSMRFGPRPARYPSRPCISLILDDYIDAVVKSTERSPVNSHFSLNHDTLTDAPTKIICPIRRSVSAEKKPFSLIFSKSFGE